mmetsp:Transcript_43931/g.64549  ORF Transcript_43931/g.64549 Transcript_43931/m.64549 type:complete len:221 (-) Transcript_43931:502-1164(-)|eukprot:CAMPEP_0195509696 /NCGR_PEP_ID=MMETSP0794_2-20130614/2550_1 /TAXON_ID=515487 /ORGANISM="Stephanopyxis turris, Strain CCMP 815" /LENGTH=220 /DNA_ID=CAMNT_0040636977 /DNA_START=472 /DNA_END=1134 /DNA_ORIENTATION=+
MNRVFGKKKSAGPPAPTLEETNQNMGKRVDHLDAKISKLDAELRGYKEKLKTTKGGAKQGYQRRAMETLKRKRMYEQQRDQLAGQQFNMEQAAFGIESAKDSISTISAMKNANVQIKQQMKQLNIDQVEDITDDLADMMEDMNEVNDTLARSYGMPNEVDEADLEAELDMLGDELEEEGEMETPSYLQDTPLPPTTLPGSKVPSAPSGVDEYGLPVANNA